LSSAPVDVQSLPVYIGQVTLGFDTREAASIEHARHMQLD
jgi:hypothetical protein